MEGLAAYNILIKPLVNKRQREEEDDFEIEKRRKVLNDECDHVSMVAVAAATTLLLQSEKRKTRITDKDRVADKAWLRELVGGRFREENAKLHKRIITYTICFL